MNSLEIQDGFVKAELKRLIKIIEIQKSYLKRQEQLQKIYSDFINIHQKWRETFLDGEITDSIKEKTNTLKRNTKMKTEETYENIENTASGPGNEYCTLPSLLDFPEELEHLENTIKSHCEDLRTLTNELNNISSISHGYKMMLKDQHFKLTTVQEKLLKKLADITKLIKMLVDGTSESKRTFLITCLAYIFDIDLPNGNYENVDETLNANFFQSISQLKWSIESLDVEQVGDTVHMFDLLIDCNEVKDEILEKQTHLNFLEHLFYFKDCVLYEYSDDFEDQQTSVSGDVIYENIETAGRKSVDGVEEQKSIRLKLQVELVYEQHLKIAKPTEIAKKNYDINSEKLSTYGDYLVKPETKKKTEEHKMSPNFRYLENKNKKPDFGFFFKNSQNSFLEKPKILQEHDSEISISKRPDSRPTKVIPVAAVRPLVKVETPESSRNNVENPSIPIIRDTSIPHLKNKDLIEKKASPYENSNFMKKSSSLSKIPDFSSRVTPLVNGDSSISYNRTYSLPAKNAHKKLCRLSESFSFKKESKKESKEEENEKKSSSLPTDFKKSSFIDWSTVQIDGELEKAADFRIENKNHLGVQSLPRKLSFKRRNSGRNLVAIQTL